MYKVLAIREDFIHPLTLSLSKGEVAQPAMVRQAHHERIA